MIPTGIHRPPRQRLRVAVIGAGPAGCIALKELLEAGHDVVGFEMRPGIGGTFSDTFAGLQLTSSNVATGFGAFPPEGERDPVIWNAAEYVRYLDAFAAHFDLLRHIRFSTRVESVRSVGDRWLLRVQPVAGAAGEIENSEGEIEVDHVAICCGFNARPERPPWADSEVFQGRIFHSSQLADLREFSGRRVLIVGLGESGSDIALAAATTATATATSTRTGPGYVIPRHYRGLPSDLDTNRCYHSLPRRLGGAPIVRFKTRIEDLLMTRSDDRRVNQMAKRLNDERGLSPFHRFGTKTTAFIEAVLYHGVSIRPDVAFLKGDRAIFSDGSEFVCDTIVCCTGYAISFPFLEAHEAEVAAKAADPRALFQRMLDPSLGKRMSFIGFVRPGIGSVPPCAEMQARYLALLLSAERQLPGPTEMERDIRHQADLDHEQFPADAQRLPTLTDYLRFMDGLADRIGCRPELGRLWLRDPLAAAKVLWGPLCGAQYRLTGPGAEPVRMRRWLRRLRTMPWPILAYELALLGGSRLLGRRRDRWRSRP